MKSYILCATDLSAAGDEAARGALALAARLGADLHLIHVVGPISGLSTISDLRLLTSFIAITEHRLASLAKNLRHPTVHVTGQVLKATGKATVAALLQKRIAKLKPKIVVIGTHGRSGKRSWPMGSFAETLAESLDAPVMVIHSARSLVNWAAKQSTLRIFAGVDLTQEAVPVLSLLKTFRNSGDCNLTVCHFNRLPLPADSMLGVLTANRGSLQKLEKDQDQLRQLLARHVGAGVQSDVEIVEGSTGAHLLDFTQNDNADLLIVGTHHRGHLARLFLGSVSRQVIRESLINILCVPLKKETPVLPGEAKRGSKRVETGPR